MGRFTFNKWNGLFSGPFPLPHTVVIHCSLELISFSSGVNSTEFRFLDASKSAVFNNDSGSIGGTISVLRMLNTGVFFFLSTTGPFFLLRPGLCLAGKDCRMARPFTEGRTTTFSSACRSPCWFFYLVPRFLRSLKIKMT